MTTEMWELHLLELEVVSIQANFVVKILVVG